MYIELYLAYLLHIFQEFINISLVVIAFLSIFLVLLFFSFYIFVISMALLEREVEKTLIPFVNFLNPEVFLVFGNNGNLNFPLI